MSEPPTRYEFEDLERRIDNTERRLDEIDRIGTRGVGILAVQVQQVSKDVGTLTQSLEAHKAEHVANRRWVIIAFTAFLAAIGGLYPFVTAVVRK